MLVQKINRKMKEISWPELRGANPQVSFPDHISDDLLKAYGVFRVHVAPAPDVDERTHMLQRSDLYQADGKWQVHFTAEPLPLAQAAHNMRAARDGFLAQTDWVVARAYEMQQPVPDAWAEYRQKLRDVPAQAGFPYTVIWPDVP